MDWPGGLGLRIPREGRRESLAKREKNPAQTGLYFFPKEPGGMG